MAEITLEGVNEKLAKGEALTKEENKFVMGLPPEDAGAGNKPATEVEEEGIVWPKEAEEEESKEEEGEAPEAKKAREEKEATDKKQKELSERAKKAGLKEDAKEEEVIAAEKKLKDEEEGKDPLVKLERALEEHKDKADNQVVLPNEWSDREKAYFWQMRRDRKARQKAEEERDAARFREIQRKNQEEAGKKKEEEVTDDPLKELREKDQEDFMTVADAIKILEKALAKPAPKEEGKEDKRVLRDPIRLRALKAWDDEARSSHPEDYDAVMELHDEIVLDNSDYLKEIAQATADGENPAEKAYQLIKQDREFSKLFPIAETKVKARKQAEKKPEDIAKEKKAQEAQDALEKNKDKTKTTGHAGGESGGGEASGTIDGYKIADIIAMSDLQFAKLPKKTREAFLQQYG